MKRILFFAATAIIFASCSNSQETADKSNQAKMDSMSQELTRQHIIDSMNSASAAVVGASPVETNGSAAQSHSGSASSGRSHSSGQSTHSGSSASSGGGSVASVPAATSNSPTGPTAAEIAAKKKADHKKELNSAAAGAMIGAGAGAIVGAVAGKNDHFKKEDALIGGGVGAVVGAGTGLLLQKRKLKRDSANK